MGYHLDAAEAATFLNNLNTYQNLHPNTARTNYGTHRSELRRCPRLTKVAVTHFYSVLATKPGFYDKAELYVWPATSSNATYWGLDASHFHITMSPNQYAGEWIIKCAMLTIRPGNATKDQKEEMVGYSSAKKLKGCHLVPLRKNSFEDSADRLILAGIYQKWRKLDNNFFPAHEIAAYEQEWNEMLAALKEELIGVLGDEWDLGLVNRGT